MTTSPRGCLPFPGKGSVTINQLREKCGNKDGPGEACAAPKWGSPGDWSLSLGSNVSISSEICNTKSKKMPSIALSFVSLWHVLHFYWGGKKINGVLLRIQHLDYTQTWNFWSLMELVTLSGTQKSCPSFGCFVAWRIYLFSGQIEFKAMALEKI